jgi:hypothetical protein
MEPWQWSSETFLNRNYRPDRMNELPTTEIKKYWKTPLSKIKDNIQVYQRYSNEIAEDLHFNKKQTDWLEHSYKQTLSDDRPVQVTGNALREHLRIRANLLKKYQSSIRQRKALIKQQKIDKMKYDARIKGFKRDFPKYWKS